MPRPLELPLVGVRVERGDAAANRARILRVARELFVAQGPEGPSIDAVAAAAGVGKGTVFRRFGDRSGLVTALLDEPMRALQDAFLQGPPPLGPGAPAAARLEAFVDALCGLVAAELPLLHAAATLPVRPAAVGSLHVHVAVLVAELRPGADPDAVSEMLLAAVSPPVVMRRLQAGDRLEDVRAAARVVLRGVTAG